MPHQHQINSLSEARFELINKDPQIKSSVRRVKGIPFVKQMPRKDPKSTTSTSNFYDPKTTLTSRSTKQVPNFDKGTARTTRSNLHST